MVKPIEDLSMFELLELLKKQNNKSKIIYILRKHRKAWRERNGLEA